MRFQTAQKSIVTRWRMPQPVKFNSCLIPECGVPRPRILCKGGYDAAEMLEKRKDKRNAPTSLEGTVVSSV